MNYSLHLKHQQQGTAQAHAEILRLAQTQRATLAASFGDLLGDGGPPEETADQMIQAIREWRDGPSTAVSTGKLTLDKGKNVYGNYRRTISRAGDDAAE